MHVKSESARLADKLFTPQESHITQLLIIKCAAKRSLKHCNKFYLKKNKTQTQAVKSEPPKASVLRLNTGKHVGTHVFLEKCISNVGLQQK